VKFEELVEPQPAHAERLKAAQDRERADRNAETLLAWYVTAFGEVVGKILFNEATR
jgi:hypothetical protein